MGETSLLRRDKTIIQKASLEEYLFAMDSLINMYIRFSARKGRTKHRIYSKLSMNATSVFDHLSSVLLIRENEATGLVPCNHIN
jgi:hypothetical protein